MIRTGRADVVVVGGTEAAIHPMPLASFAAMQALCTRNDAPETASRPYDTSRDGFVMGDGAGILVLESEAYARARGARVHAEVLGAGTSSDAYHIAAPEPEGAGASRAVLEALEVSGVSARDVVHVNAHATSTPVGDLAEVKALRVALGVDLDHVAVSATKSMTGHMLGAAGAVESIFTILALHHRLAPPTINVDDLDPAADIDVVRKEPRELPDGIAAQQRLRLRRAQRGRRVRPRELTRSPLPAPNGRRATQTPHEGGLGGPAPTRGWTGRAQPTRCSQRTGLPSPA